MNFLIQTTLKGAGAMVCAAIATACATTAPPSRQTAAADHLSQTYLPRDIKGAENAALAALDRSDLNRVSFAARQSSRAAIGQTAPADVAAHEHGAPISVVRAAPAAKLGNTGGDGVIVLAQNGTLAGG